MKSKDLLGITTKSGWTLKEEREPVIRKSGGCHSFAYIAENANGERAFVKVLDITVRPDVENPLAEIKDRIAKFEYELELAKQCKEAL